MKLSDIRAEIEEEAADTATDADEAVTHEEEDFWEALDLLETSRKLIIATLKRETELGDVRRRLLQNHSDDIFQFLDNFLELKDDDNSKGSAC